MQNQPRNNCFAAKRPDGELWESVHHRWLNCEGSSNNGYRYRDSIHADGKEFKGEEWAIAIDALIEGMAENARSIEAGDPTAIETCVPMDRRLRVGLFGGFADATITNPAFCVTAVLVNTTPEFKRMHDG